MTMEERTRSTSSPSRRTETQVVRESRGIFVVISPLHRNRSTHFIRKIFLQRKKVCVSQTFYAMRKIFRVTLRIVFAMRTRREWHACHSQLTSRSTPDMCEKVFRVVIASTISPTCQPLHARDASRCSRCARLSDDNHDRFTRELVDT